MQSPRHRPCRIAPSSEPQAVPGALQASRLKRKKGERLGSPSIDLLLLYRLSEREARKTQVQVNSLQVAATHGHHCFCMYVWALRMPVCACPAK